MILSVKYGLLMSVCGYLVLRTGQAMASDAKSLLTGNRDVISLATSRLHPSFSDRKIHLRAVLFACCSSTLVSRPSL